MKHKCKVAKPNCNMGHYYMCMESQHAKHEWVFCSGGKDIIVDMIIVGQCGWKEEN
jgi:hypothetical protein